MKEFRVMYKDKELMLQPYGMRQAVLFEELKSRLYDGTNLIDNFYLFWISVGCAWSDAHGEGKVTFEEFSKWVDDNPQTFADYMNWLADYFS